MDLDSKIEALREHYEFAAYQSFETHRFPRSLEFRGWGPRSIEVQVEKLMRVRSFASNEFEPSEGSQVRAFCEEPEILGQVNPVPAPGTIPFAFSNLDVVMQSVVSPIGGIRQVRVVYSSDPLNNKELMNWFIGTHFPIERCAGTPIEYETVIHLAWGH